MPSIAVGFELVGVDTAIRALGRVGDRVLAVIEPPLMRGGFRVEAGLKTAPAPPPNSSYRRTGTLPRRWDTKKFAGAGFITVIVGNNTSYGPWVQSEQQQALMHRGRWPTDERELERQRLHILTGVAGAIQTLQ